MARCFDSRDAHYSDYGGRGITVCEPWKDFRNFLADMGVKPEPHYTIERDDFNGHYEPGNCRWIPKKDQNHNTRQSHFLEHGGVRLNVTQWAIKLGIPRWVIYKRIRTGWTVQEALTIPVGQRRV